MTRIKRGLVLISSPAPCRPVQRAAAAPPTNVGERMERMKQPDWLETADPNIVAEPARPFSPAVNYDW